VVVENLAFAEGPRWHDGQLWFSDMLDDRVMTLEANGSVQEVVTVPGHPSGLGWDMEGRLLIVSMQTRTLQRYDGSRTLTVMADLSRFTAHPFNDMIVGGDGRAYVGNMGYEPFTSQRPQPSFIAKVEPNGLLKLLRAA